MAHDGRRPGADLHSAQDRNLSREAALWPTPDAAISNDGEQPETFFARRDRVRVDLGNGNGMGIPLAMAAKTWPTPTANDWKGSGPTLERKDGQMRGDRLDYATEQLWSTPRASDAEKGGPNQSFSAGGVPLPAQASQWMTPRSHEAGQYQYSRGDKTNPVATLTGQALAIYSPLALVTVKTGKPHSSERRSLNPLFVEWLMGWPPGWTLLASTDFGCSETALSVWKARMRSALWQLGLPPKGPPVQPSLFA
jgi:hypothetical protein